MGAANSNRPAINPERNPLATVLLCGYVRVALATQAPQIVMVIGPAFMQRLDVIYFDRKGYATTLDALNTKRIAV